MIYMFDMDGTLTPARKPMEEDFAKCFLPWLQKNKAFIVTGSDIAKVLEQLPSDVVNAFSGIYCAMGNDLWRKGDFVYHHDFVPEPELLADLENYRLTSAYPYSLFPNYLEKRTGMVNFSILGRDCPYAERERYGSWDKTAGERLRIQKELSRRYPQYDFVLGGSISIDITKKGCGKGQVASHLRGEYPEEEITFFGDKTLPGGNDYELAAALRLLPATKVVQVNSPDDVLTYLELYRQQQAA